MKKYHIEVIDREFAAILAAKTPAERVAMVGEMNRMARLLMAAGTRNLHPDWTEDQIQAEVIRRMAHGAA